MRRLCRFTKRSGTRIRRNPTCGSSAAASSNRCIPSASTSTSPAAAVATPKNFSRDSTTSCRQTATPATRKPPARHMPSAVHIARRYFVEAIPPDAAERRPPRQHLQRSHRADHRSLCHRQRAYRTHERRARRTASVSAPSATSPSAARIGCSATPRKEPRPAPPSTASSRLPRPTA